METHIMETHTATQRPIMQCEACLARFRMTQDTSTLLPLCPPCESDSPPEQDCSIPMHTDRQGRS